MNAITRFVIPLPQIAKIDVVEYLVVRVTWSAGIRVGRTDIVDLSPMINSLRLYRPLRQDHALFRTAHLIEEGRILAWGDDDQIDMAADSIEELAEETMTGDDLRDFLKANDLTHSEAAALLDRSRRTIENYLSGKEPIPRVFVMACFGYVARKQILRGPITKLAHTQVQVNVMETSTKLVGTRRQSPHIVKPNSLSPISPPVRETSGLLR